MLKLCRMLRNLPADLFALQVMTAAADLEDESGKHPEHTETCTWAGVVGGYADAMNRPAEALRFNEASSEK